MLGQLWILAAFLAAAPDDRAWEIAFDVDRLRDLPSGHDWASLLETVHPAAVLDRIDGGGLGLGKRALLGMSGSSWTQTRHRLDGLDATDPVRAGTSLLFVDLDALEAVVVDSAAFAADVGSPGPVVTLAPKRAGTTWRGTAHAGTLAHRGGDASAPPPIGRLDAWNHASLTVGGPVAKDRLAVVASGTWTSSRRFERSDPMPLNARVASAVAHATWTPRAAEEARLLAVVQDARQDSAGTDRLLHLQAAWKRRTPAGSAWAAIAGYERAAVSPSIDTRPLSRPLERLRDGPIPDRVLAGQATGERWALGVQNAPPTLGRHRLSWGVMLDAVRARNRPSGLPALAAETVDGLAARVWEYEDPGKESHWSTTEAALYATDRMTLPARVALEAGGRFEWTRGSARGAEQGITWQSLSPRVGLRWDVAPMDLLAFLAGFGRYRHALPLTDLAFGDPAAPHGAVYRWSDANRDGLFQADERGALVARVGPGGALAAIDPRLKPPITTEWTAGLESRFGGGWSVRLLGLYRRERDLVESVNVGVPISAYRVILVPDPAGNIVSGDDDQLLPIYDRLPSSFGQDRYLLTNPTGHTTLHEGVALTIEKAFGSRGHVLVGGTAFRVDGLGGYRGFHASENDQGLVGELFDQPNTATFARGRLFFDRAYTLKVSGSYRAPGDVRVGVAARYLDGQPFARLVVYPDLHQGPEAVQAIPRGRSRFSFLVTVDARVEKGFRVRGRRLAAVLEALNLTNMRNEVEEDVRTGPSFRTVTAVQPPRVLRVELRFDF